MKIIYAAIIYIYIFIIRISSIFNDKAKKFITGRKDWHENLKKKVKSEARYLWFHCPSLGEFEQGRPVIEKIKNNYPGYDIIVTFFSPSGYEIRKNYKGAEIVCYLPFDSSRNSRRFIDLVKPEKAFFIKYDFWFFFITELKKHNIPTYLISAIFREKQIFFRNNPWGKWYRKILLNFEHLFVQDQKSIRLLSNIGIVNVTVSGDTRFDRVGEIARNSANYTAVDKFKGKYPLLIAGSTWKPDEEILTEFINNHNDIKIIFAPHEVTPGNISRLQNMIKISSFKYSEADKINPEDYNVLIIDSIGLLSSLYKYGTIAYIGGGFGVGIHNILEAATFGLPVIFGPNHQKFREAKDLKTEGGAFPVNNYEELTNILNILLNDHEAREKASKICSKYIINNMGSTNLIIKKVFNR